VTLEEEKHHDVDDHADGHDKGHHHHHDGLGPEHHGYGHDDHGHAHLTDKELNWRCRIFMTLEEPDFRCVCVWVVCDAIVGCLLSELI
jgi:hypothetical protein